MKNERVLVTILLILIAIIAFIVFGYISSLKEENITLSNNLNQIIKRITVLESDKTMEKITALKAENAKLKKQIIDLKVKLSRVSKKLPKSPAPEAKQQIKKEKTTSANQGFLIKGSKPTH
jgi:predicted PurR-regulated permease PerM